MSTEEKPTICPKCKSPYWDKPRKIEAAKRRAILKHLGEKRRAMADESKSG